MRREGTIKKFKSVRVPIGSDLRAELLASIAQARLTFALRQTLAGCTAASCYAGKICPNLWGRYVK